MAFEPVRGVLILAVAMLALAGCKKDAPKPQAEEGGGPQLATSIDDYALPVDKSDQITAIDAATGDAGGMPKDGGGVVALPKPEAKPDVQPPETPAAVAAPVTAPPAPAPMVTPPPPPVPATAAAGGN